MLEELGGTALVMRVNLKSCYYQWGFLFLLTAMEVYDKNLQASPTFISSKFRYAHELLGSRLSQVLGWILHYDSSEYVLAIKNSS